MPTSLQPGASTTRTLSVDTTRTIAFLGPELRIYATPELVRDIEETCLEFLLAHVDAGENSVGTGIELAHLAATPLGMAVEITATVTEVDGRSVTFEVIARDAEEEICRATHSRFVVGVEKLRVRVAAKAARAAAGLAATDAARRGA